MKKEKKADIKSSSPDSNNAGTWSFITGLLSILVSLAPIAGVLLGVAGIFLAYRQDKKRKNEWSKVGRILSILGIVFSIAAFLFGLYLQNNPEILAQYGSVYAQ